MKLSFIIPVYNAAQTIKQTLESIFDQTLERDDYEVLVINNGSTDETQQIVAEFSSVKLIHVSWKSRSRARNLGAQKAEGTYLAFIDGDVVLSRNWAQVQLECMEKTASAAGAGATVPANFDGQERLNRFRHRLSFESTKGTFNILTLRVVESPMINSAACIYRRRTFLENGGFDPELERHEDIDLSRRLYLQGHQLMIVENAVAYVSYHDSGWLSYFRRSFEEGWTKTDYLKKWSSQAIMPEIKTHTNFYFVWQDMISPMLRFFVSFDSYYILKAWNNFLRSLGRFLGLVFKKPMYTPMENISSDRLGRIIQS